MGIGLAEFFNVFSPDDYIVDSRGMVSDVTIFDTAHKTDVELFN